MDRNAPRRGSLRGANRRSQEILISLLREIREEKGLPQTELAKALGRRQSFVAKYENGARRLDLLELKEVCDAVGIELLNFVHRFEAALRPPEEGRKSKRQTTRTKRR